jgi:hypothetical protein
MPLSGFQCENKTLNGKYLHNIVSIAALTLADYDYRNQAI